ncbi:MAG: hypothetical protein SFT92_09330 [Rickettsiales bacterium]|nr:hypothetical protein [Rickettsiales bacterium]
MSQYSPDDLLNAIAQFIEESRVHIEQGAYTELSGLEDHVRTLCEAVMTLSQEERDHYSERLKFLFDELTLLGNVLVHKRDELNDQMKELSSHKKANIAYKVADASDKKKNETN